MFKRIDHVALHVSDIDKSKTFYKNFFGFTDYYDQITETGIKITYLKLGDTILELVDRKDCSLKGFHWCIETTNFDNACRYLTNGKVTMLQTPHSTDARTTQEKGWRRAVFEGPDGEQIEIRG